MSIAGRIAHGGNGFNLTGIASLNLLQALAVLSDLEFIELYGLPSIGTLNASLFDVAILNIITDHNPPGKCPLALDVLSRILFLAALLFEDAFSNRTVDLVSAVEEVQVSS